MSAGDPEGSSDACVLHSCQGCSADAAGRARAPSHVAFILQVVVSIQGLILVPEPYYNEPSYEQYRGTEEGQRASTQVPLPCRPATMSTQDR